MLRLSEHYVSVQGEGPNTGVLTQFVRFAGCNMRCPGWPCDTPHAIEPSIWVHESEKITYKELFNQIADKAMETSATNICLTGGEPFMQNNEDLRHLAGLCHKANLTIECFSNGSFVYPDWAIRTMQFMMDWKLSGSGEAETKVRERTANARQLKETDGIKFVCKDQQDLNEAMTLMAALQINEVKAQFWVGSAWLQINESDIVDFTIEKAVPWRLNLQTHKYIFPADERGV